MLTNEELKIAKKKYQLQIYNVEGRNRVDLNGNPIEMRLTFDEWIDIWLSSGHWHERGAYKGQYVMSRINDTGHYEIGNVEIKTAKENNIEKTKSSKWLNSRKIMAASDSYKEATAARSLNKNWIEGVEKGAAARRKQISCDGVIFPSRTAAALALAPTHLKDKTDWIHNQIKKYPERFFYI